MEQNFEKVIIEFVEESFKKEEINYRNILKVHLNDGLDFEYSFKIIETAINKKLDNVNNPVYNDLTYLLGKIKKNYAKEKFDKAIQSEEFRKDLESKNINLEEFIQLHKDCKKEFEVLVFHQQNREIFKRYFMIYYDDNIKNKLSYDDLKLFRGGSNKKAIMDEVERLNNILFPPSKINNYKIKKYGVNLSSKDVAVFMILFKDYYKINIKTHVEFLRLTKLIFDDLHFNINAGNAKFGTSIEKYLRGKELFNSKFKYDTSKSKVLEILSELNLKEFKKHVEAIKSDKFESLLS